MDTSDPDIVFGPDGVCNHCSEWQRGLDTLLARREREPWPEVARRLRDRGRNRRYDCVLGLSGGVDSSYVALLAHRERLRVLAVHLDNGWNSELAVQNIEVLVKKLDFDLTTHVVDWQEFRDIQVAFFRASVVDIEMPTDHAITALTNRVAREHRVPTVLRGVNFASEGIMPRAWRHTKTDRRNLLGITRRFSSTQPDTLPMTSTARILLGGLARRTGYVDVLDYVEYDRAKAIDELEAELGWRPYGGKHHESRFTAFYQAYVLPRKFGFDKRRAHFSTLVNAGQMTREQALSALTEPVTDVHRLEDDKQYVMKKLGVSLDEFDEWMAEAPRSHYDFPSERAYLDPLRAAAKVLRRVRPRRQPLDDVTS